MSISEIGRKWVRDFLELGGEGRLLEGDAEEKWGVMERRPFLLLELDSRNLE